MVLNTREASGSFWRRFIQAEHAGNWGARYAGSDASGHCVRLVLGTGRSEHADPHGMSTARSTPVSTVCPIVLRVEPLWVNGIGWTYRSNQAGAAAIVVVPAPLATR